jgi:hypothetical protein
MAAMSFLVHLEPEAAQARLRERCSALKKMIGEREAVLAQVREHVPRIHLVESEYLLAMQRAELEWTRRLAEQIGSGELSWDVGRILREAALEAGEGTKRVEGE